MEDMTLDMCCPRRIGLCLFAVIFVVGIGTPLAHSQNVKPTVTGKKNGLIPRKLLFGSPERAGAKISPDGTQISYLAPVKGVLNVWVAPVNDLKAARPVTKEKKRGINTYFWAFTNNHILYTQDADGDENFHLFVADLKTNKIRDLTPNSGKQNEKKKIRVRIQQVSHKFPEHILIGVNDRIPQLHDVYKINILTGKKKLIQKNNGFLGYLSDDNYNIRLGVKFSRKAELIVEKQNGKAEWESFFKIGPQDTLTTSPVGFDASGEKVYMIDSRGRNTSALVLFDLKTKKSKVLATNKLADVAGISLHPTKKTLQAVAFNYKRVERQFFDAATKKDYARLSKINSGDISVTSGTLDDRKWVVVFTQDNGPARYYLYNRDSGKAKFLFTNRPKLKGWKLQRMHPMVLPARDGLKLVCYLTLPLSKDKNQDGKLDDGEPIPMVLLVHGGPWARDKFGYNTLHQFLANRGYAVLSVNYRGSVGFGKEFINAANKEWAGKMHDDLIDAVDAIIEKKIADPKKVAIMGGSYGGYATLVGLTFTPKKFACGVDIVGPSNLLTLIQNVPAYWVPQLPLLRTRVGDFTTPEGRSFLKQRSPLTFVANIEKPLLIGQGANDPRVKKLESDQIVAAMEKRKLPVVYALYPDEGHGFARPVNKLSFFALTEAFLAQHLGGRYQALQGTMKKSTVQVLSGSDQIPGLPKLLKKN